MNLDVHSHFRHNGAKYIMHRFVYMHTNRCKCRMNTYLMLWEKTNTCPGKGPSILEDFIKNYAEYWG